LALQGAYQAKRISEHWQQMSQLKKLEIKLFS
jgi:hypothetical protein